MPEAVVFHRMRQCFDGIRLAGRHNVPVIPAGRDKAFRAGPCGLRRHSPGLSRMNAILAMDKPTGGNSGNRGGNLDLQEAGASGFCSPDLPAEKLSLGAISVRCGGPSASNTASIQVCLRHGSGACQMGNCGVGGKCRGCSRYDSGTVIGSEGTWASYPPDAPFFAASRAFQNDAGGFRHPWKRTGQAVRYHRCR
jgi:hypothetical protein